MAVEKLGHAAQCSHISLLSWIPAPCPWGSWGSKSRAWPRAGGSPAAPSSPCPAAAPGAGPACLWLAERGRAGSRGCISFHGANEPQLPVGWEGRKATGSFVGAAHARSSSCGPESVAAPGQGTRLPLVPRSCHLLPRRHFESIWGCSHLSSWTAAHPKAHPAALLLCGPMKGAGRKALRGCWPGCPTPLVPGLPLANVVCSPLCWPTLCAWPTLCVRPEQRSGFLFFSVNSNLLQSPACREAPPSAYRYTHFKNEK